VAQLYTRLINEDHAQFLFSPYSSGLTAPAAVITEQYGKIMIDSGGAEEKPFELGNKYLFMVITSAKHYLSGAIEALKLKDPHAKIAMVYSDDPFSKDVLTAAKKQAEDTGLQVVMDESYAPSTRGPASRDRSLRFGPGTTACWKRFILRKLPASGSRARQRSLAPLAAEAPSLVVPRLASSGVRFARPQTPRRRDGRQLFAC
jgi:Periplasmic binding protein